MLPACDRHSIRDRVATKDFVGEISQQQRGHKQPGKRGQNASGKVGEWLLTKREGRKAVKFQPRLPSHA